MPEIVTKAEDARRVGVTEAAVSMWISRRQLTAPALRADGTVDAGLADRQLEIEIDPIRQAGQMRNPPRPELTQIQKLRVAEKAIAVEQQRRRLEEQRGKYVLARAVETRWTRTIADFLQAVEQGFPDLAREAFVSSLVGTGIVPSPPARW